MKRPSLVSAASFVVGALIGLLVFQLFLKPWILSW